MGWEETLGNVLVFGFGPDVARGLIAEYLGRIPIVKCREYIIENRNLMEPVTERQWRLIRETTRAGKIALSYEEVIKELSKHRPDILAIIATTEGGVDWLNRQVEQARQKLTP